MLDERNAGIEGNNTSTSSTTETPVTEPPKYTCFKCEPPTCLYPSKCENALRVR